MGITTFGPKNGAFQDYLEGLPDITFDYAAILASYPDVYTGEGTVVSETATQIVVVTKAVGQPDLTMTLRGSGLVGDAPAMFDSLTLAKGSTVFLSYALTSTQFTLISGDVTVTVDGAFDRNLLNVFNFIDDGYLGSSTISGFHVREGGVLRFEGTISATEVVVDLGDYSLHLVGTFPSPLAAMALFVPLTPVSGNAGELTSISVVHDATGALAQSIDASDYNPPLSLTDLMNADDLAAAKALLASWLRGPLDASASDTALLLDQRGGGGLSLITEALGFTFDPAEITFRDIRGSRFADTIYGGAGTWTIDGGAGHDVIEARTGIIYGGEGNDTILNQGDAGLYGGSGNDSLRGVSGGFLGGDGGNDTLIGGTRLEGGDGDDLLVAQEITEASVIVDGGAGADTMRGSKSDDTYFVDNVRDVVVEQVDGGLLDEVYSSISIDRVWDNIERVTLRGSADLHLTANDAGNSLVGNSGNNLLTGRDQADDLHGRDGDDTLIGAGGDDFLMGGAGADSLEGGDGDNTFFGEAGADTMRGGHGNDKYYVDSIDDLVIEADGSGIDRVYTSVSYTIGDDIEELSLYFAGFGSSITGIANDRDNYIEGGTGNDSLEGRGGNDSVHGIFGNDSVDGGDGNDTIVVGGFAGTHNLLKGGDGDDLISGGNGTDTLSGGTGNDTLTAYMDADSVSGGAGDDFVDGGAGNDTLAGDAGVDTLLGGDSNDRIDESGDTTNGNQLIGESGADTLLGGAGGEYFLGGAGVDSINAGAGNDTVLEFTDLTAANRIDGGGGNDMIHGGGGADSIVGGTGADTVYGSSGDDLINDRGDHGSSVDVLVGDAGNDTIWGSNGRGGVLDDLIVGGDGNDSLAGNDGNDWLIGDGTIGTGNDTLDGGAGSDTLEAGNGDDSLTGGAGFDVIYGGDGNDTIDESGDSGANSNVLIGEANNDSIIGGSGQDAASGIGDLVMGGGGNDTLKGMGGGDLIYGDNADGTGTGADSIDGGDGNDQIWAGAGADTIVGSAGYDVVYAGSGTDLIDYSGDANGSVLVGEAGNDTIFGGGGTDFLAGGEGNDLLRAGAGGDVLSLGGGRDIVVYGGIGDGGDTILDFQVGTDVFGFAVSGFPDLNIGTLVAFDDAVTGQTPRETAPPPPDLYSLIMTRADGGPVTAFVVTGTVVSLGTYATGTVNLTHVAVIQDGTFATAVEAMAAVNAGPGTDFTGGTIVVYRAGADDFRLSYEAGGSETFLAALGGVTDANVANLGDSDFLFWG